MAIVVVGGNARNIGKTSVIEGIIRAFPEMRWMALKITQHDHGMHETAADTVAVSEERDVLAGTDTSRYLAAGAVRSLLVQVEAGQMGDAMPRIHEELADAENIVIESNSILQFLQPDVYLSVLEPRVEDFKGSARLYLERADAVLVAGEGMQSSAWKHVSLKLPKEAIVLRTDPPHFVTSEVKAFLAERLG